MTDDLRTDQSGDDPAERLRQQSGPLDARQVAVWRKMTPTQRLRIVFQAYHFALQVVRATERRQHPNLSEEELKWRGIRRMHGDPNPGPEVTTADQ